MARDGVRIFDADTHVGPSMDVLEHYLSAGAVELRLQYGVGRPERRYRSAH